MTTIQDLPVEVLVIIFNYLRPNLHNLLELATLCSKFRQAAFGCPVPVRLPLQDEQLKIMSRYKIPVSSLFNSQSALYVKYQVGHLNLSRLTEAQLVANDYLAKSNRTTLSPHYLDILNHLATTKNTTRTLRTLLLNVDLSSAAENSERATYKCAQLLSQFKNLRFLSLHFTPHIELQEKIKSSPTSQHSLQTQFIDCILEHMPKLKTLYLYSCPVQKLSISSSSLEKLSIYKSEFVEIRHLNAPNLLVLMFHEGLTGYFKKIRENREAGQANSELDLFKVLHDGCPQIEYFNSVQLGVLRPHHLQRDDWCHYALRLCVKKYQRRYGSGVDMPLL